MTLAVEVDSGSSTIADTSFDVPYVKWGMKNPSTFFLRVSDKVQISIHAVARVTNAGMAKASHSEEHQQVKNCHIQPCRF